MSTRSIFRSIAGIVLVTLASSAWAQAPKPERAPLARGDVSFMKKAGEHGLAEVELGRLAQEKGMREEVKSFGARMVADHGKANEELMRIAASKGVQLPTAPARNHQRDMEKLRKHSGPDFDREYMKRMVSDHRKDVRDFERQAKNARDPEIREFARQQLTVLRAHLGAAQATYDLATGSKRARKRETGSTKP